MPPMDEIVAFHPILIISSKFYDVGSVDGNFIHGKMNKYFISSFRFCYLVFLFRLKH